MLKTKAQKIGAKIISHFNDKKSYDEIKKNN